MIVEINGTEVDVPDGTTLLGLIEQRLGTTRGAALVVDGAVVPRGDWPHALVGAGQVVELITAVQGG